MLTPLYKPCSFNFVHILTNYPSAEIASKDLVAAASGAEERGVDLGTGTQQSLAAE